jgi:hypothetical protein
MNKLVTYMVSKEQYEDYGVVRRLTEWTLGILGDNFVETVGVLVFFFSFFLDKLLLFIHLSRKRAQLSATLRPNNFVH